MIDFEKIYAYSKDLKVLYVEDEEEVRKHTLVLLEEYFSTVDTAIDGLDGIEKYKKYYSEHSCYYDLIISDIAMPNFNGIEMSYEILELNNDQMIIMISAHSEPMYLFELINLGISSFLSKPINIQQWHRVLYRVSKEISIQKIEYKRKEYEKAERKFLLGVMDLQDNIIVITDGKQIESANQAFLEFFDITSVDDFKQKNECICQAFIESKGYFHDGLLQENELWIEHILQHQDTDFTVLMQNKKTLKKESFKIGVNYFHSKQRYIASFSNISKIALKNQIDQYRAEHDSLTEIYNRHKLNDLLKSHFSPLMQTEVQHFAFILFDIDHFKEINDTYGHLTGDQVLKQLTSIVKNNIRGDDIFIRWGGDEFILVIDHITAEKAIKIAEHLRHSIEQYIFDKVGQLTCSFGVSIYQNGDTLNQMIRRVDQAMYHAKNAGRNQIAYI